MRIILLNNDENSEFKGFDIKSHKVYQEQLFQPTFSNNYFHGYIQTYNSIFKDDLEFKIIFNNQ